MTTFRTSTGIITAFAFAIALSFATPTRGQTWLLDFGNNITFRGTNVVNPDSNGNYWNSLSFNFAPGLLDINGNPTTMAFGLDGLGGTDSFNGPAGDTSAGLHTVSNAVFNPGALGNLGVTNAVYDYFATAFFQLQGLDPTKLYKLTFFGSHKFNDDNTTVYSVTGDAGYSNVLASTSLLVGVNGDHNQDTVAVINNVSPQANTIMYIKFLGSNGNLGYLNAMQLEVVPEPATVTLVGLGLLSVVAALRRRRTS